MEPELVALFSGGIDSPVACALMARRFRILPVHFFGGPYAGKGNLERTVEALERLAPLCAFQKIVAVPWFAFLDKLVRSDYRGYTCLLCKRGMIKVAERICQAEGASGILTGEALGQKASQTLPNLLALSHGIRFPVLRPLLGMDKLEIERLSKKFGIWSPSHAGGCKAVPPLPRTAAEPETLERIFSGLGLAEERDRLYALRVEVKKPREVLAVGNILERQ
jgi:thiamine biosynthesis protein ThiI